MADINADKNQQHRLTVAEGEVASESEKPQKMKRVASLDIFRGLTVVMMILVDDAGGEWQMIGHAPWNGCNLADFVMPFFLFIVGMAIALALKRKPNRFMAIKKIRWFGILQRIALAYLVVALVEISTKNARAEERSPGWCSIFKLYYWQWLLGACVLVIYLAFIYGIYVPDWHFTVNNRDYRDYGKVFTVACGVRGKLDPPCNAVGYIDREVLGINHMYQHPAWARSKACTEKSPYEGPFLEDAPSWCRAPFEPEGILSSISSILTTIIGVHFGHVLIHMKGHLDRLKHWIVMGLALIVSGIVLHFTGAIPLNKQLYSISYVCLTAGAAALVFSTFYALVDIWGMRYLFLPLEWIGMNAMLVYVMAAEGIFAGFINGWYYDDPHNTLIYWIQKHIFIGVWHSRRVGILLYVIFAEILFWGLVAGILHRFGIHWKL